MSPAASKTFPITVNALFLCLALITFPRAAVTQTDCPDTLTYRQFLDYTKTFPQCMSSNGRSIFRTDSGLLYSVYDDDDNFVGNPDYSALTTFCRELEECKNALSSCQGSLSTFIESAGRALCQNGDAMDQKIREAISTLSTDKCDINELLEMDTSSDGCSLANDGAQFPTYVQQVDRNRKVETAKVRCNARFQERVCSPASTEAYTRIMAATEFVELIGMSYSDYTDYKTPEFGGEKTYLSLHGLTHVKNQDGYSTCRGLSSAPLLLWNPYLRIDGVLMPVQPMSPYSALKSVTINFVVDGVTVGTYTTSADDETLSLKTRKQHAGIENKEVKAVKVSSVSGEQVLLSHYKTQTNVIVGRAGDNLFLSVSLPTSLYNRETVGLLAEGCEVYGGTTETSVSGSEPCDQACSPFDQKQLCSFDCAGRVTEYETLYKDLRGAEEELKSADETSSASSLLASLMTCALVCLMTQLLH